MDELLTTGGAAKWLALSADRIRQLEREGKLQAQKAQNGQRLFRVCDVDRYAREMKKGTRNGAPKKVVSS